jgi:Zn2+/Cd2+-exporting ATPase
MIRISQGKQLMVAGILAGTGYVLNKVLGYQPVTISFMIAAAAVAGLPIFLKAARALRFKVVGIDALVTIAVAGALLIGEYWEAAAVTFLFRLGDYLEARTIEKTRSSIKALLDLAPVTARVRRGGMELTLAPAEVQPGDTVIVKPGEKIAVDGTVLAGSAYVNQAAITGESLPVSRSAGDPVYSGTIPESGYLIIQADRVGDDTTFARILQLVEDAQDKKARTQQFLEKFSRFYTPGIILLACILFLTTRDLVLALTLLVIACPGALVISAPVSIVAGIGNGARHGVLVKGGDIMEKLGRVKNMAFDKTGTLTLGLPAVQRVMASGEGDEDWLLRLAAIGESYSEHPLARAIVRSAEKKLGPIVEKPSDTAVITGQGLTFTWSGQTYLLGNRRLFLGHGFQLDDWQAILQAEEDKGHTAVLVGRLDGSGRLLGLIAVADQIRPAAREAVAKLKASGIRKVIMLTGDNSRAARAISEELGLDGYYAELLPEDKVRVLGAVQQRYGPVAMVGDGVNDAPALASADLGIAVGGAGSDVAMETADVVLLSQDVSAIAYAIGLSRTTVRNMKQNIGFAILVAGFLLAGVLVKTVNLSFGMLIHEISVLLVIINAVRLLGYRDYNKRVGYRRRSNEPDPINRQENLRDEQVQ